MQLPYLLEGYDVVGSSIDEYDENGNFLNKKSTIKWFRNKEINSYRTYKSYDS